MSWYDMFVGKYLQNYWIAMKEEKWHYNFCRCNKSENFWSLMSIKFYQYWCIQPSMFAQNFIFLTVKYIL